MKLCTQCGAEIPADGGELCRPCILLLALDSEEASPCRIPDLGVKLRHFGDFELIEEIARGGMGVVFRAYQISLNRTVALKLIASERLASREARRRFEIEAEAAASLDHPNIVPIYGRGEHEGMPYLCMRLIEGASLAEALRSRGFQPQPGLIAKIARAVHYAHRRGLLHRDLKPSNILLDQEGEPYVTDFGLAKHVEARGADLTRTTAILGTPHYMSPEQCRGNGGTVSVASDVFSLGIILHEVLAGKVPFASDSTLEVMRQIADAEPVRPLTNVHRDLDTICRKALEKDPGERYGSALALAEDLERYARGEPILARPVGTAEILLKWARRNRALTGVTLAALASLIGATVIALWLAHSAQQATRREQAARREMAANLYPTDMVLAEQEFLAGRPMAARDRLARHIPEDGESFDPRGWEWRWLWQQTEPDYERIFLGHELPVTSVALLPGENRVLSGSIDGTVRRWDLESGEAHVLLKGLDEVHNLAVSPDGRWLALSTHHTSWEPFEAVTTTTVYELKGDTAVRIGEGVRSSWKNYQLRFVEVPGQGTQLLLCMKVPSGGQWHAWDFSDPSASPRPLWRAFEPSAVLAVSDQGRHLAILEKKGNGKLGGEVMATATREIHAFGLPDTSSFTVDFLSFSPDGSRLAMLVTSSEDRDEKEKCSFAAVFEVKTGEVMCRTPLLAEDYDSLALLEDGRLILVSDQHALQLWAIEEGEPSRLALTKTLIGHRDRARIGPVVRGALITASADRRLCEWRLDQSRSSSVSQTRHTRTRPILAAISEDGQVIAGNAGIVEDSQQFVVWNNRLRRITHRLHGLVFHLSKNGSLLKSWHYQTPANAPEGAYAGRGTYPAMTISAIEHWDLTSTPARSIRVLPVSSPVKGVTGGSASLDGKWVVVGSLDGSVRMIETDTGVVRKLPHRSRIPIAGAGISPDHRFVAYTGRMAGLYDVEANQWIRDLPPSKENIMNPVFSWDSRLLAHATSDGRVYVYSMEDPLGDPVVLTSSNSQVRCLAFSPDGKTLAARHQSGVVRFWNVATWESTIRMESNWYVRFSADGRCLLTDGNHTQASTEGRITIREVPRLDELIIR